MTVSLQMRRAIQQCSQADGTFSMLAIDQRGSLIRALNDHKGSNVSYGEIGAFKSDIVRTLSPHASATLIDAEYGYPAVVASDAFPGSSGMLLALEKSGYDGDPTLRRSELLEGWSPAQIRNAGATGVKLLVYYRPDAANAADQETLVSEVAQMAHAVELPLFLEPLHYSLDANVKKVPNAERREIVIESAKRLVPLGVDVLKAEFPVDVFQTDDEVEWADACDELSAACPSIPWVLLSAGVDYDLFVRQVHVACQHGASGILCGRAVWKEAMTLDAADRANFLRETSVPRFQRLAQMVSAFARPYTDFYPSSDGSDAEGWYVD